VEIWLMLQVFAFGAFVCFGSYLTYRRRSKQAKKAERQAILV